MASMKLKERDRATPVNPSTDSEYGYGTALNLEQEQIDALGIAGLKPGTVVQVTGTGMVKSVGMSEDMKSKSGHMCIQITDMEASAEKATMSPADALYGSETV